MRRRLFLCGGPSRNSFFLIKEILGSKLSEAGGYFIEQPPSSEGAFELFPAAAAAGVDGFDGLRFFDISVQPPFRDNDVFRYKARELLGEAVYYPFSLLAPIGGFELVIPEYRAALESFLSAGLPCVGTLRPSVEAEWQRKALGLGERYPALAEKLCAVLAADGETLLLDVGKHGDEYTKGILLDWRREYAF